MVWIQYLQACWLPPSINILCEILCLAGSTEQKTCASLRELGVLCDRRHVTQNFQPDQDCIEQGLANFFLNGQVANLFGFAVCWEVPKAIPRFDDSLGLTRLSPCLYLQSWFLIAKRYKSYQQREKAHWAKSEGNQVPAPKGPLLVVTKDALNSTSKELRPHRWDVTDWESSCRLAGFLSGLVM